MSEILQLYTFIYGFMMLKFCEKFLKCVEYFIIKTLKQPLVRMNHMSL